MKVLVKYKKIMFLVDENLDKDLLVKSLSNIVELHELSCKVLQDTYNASDEDLRKIESQKQELKYFIDNSKVIGFPFDTEDAQLYAKNKALDYKTLELHGNAGKTNAKKETVKDSQIQMRVSTKKNRPM
jgi:hypothetical protein